MNKLILIRHGESQWNLENRFTGWIDIPLTETGRKQARLSGEKIATIKIDIAFTSVLDRAIETLTIALDGAKQTNVPYSKHQALNERHYGALQGLNKKETAEKYGDAQVKIWRRSYDVPPPKDITEQNPDGFSESLKDTAARTLPYFESVIMPEIRKGKNVVISAHGNSLRAIVMMLDNLTKEEVLELNIPNGEPIVYTFGAGKVIKKETL